MDINEFKLFCEGVINKNQSGNTFTPAAFNLNVWRALIGFVQSEYEKYKSTDVVSDVLDSVLVHLPSPIPQNGQFIFPIDWLHTSSARYYSPQVGGGFKEINIEEVENRDLGLMLQSDLEGPTARFPKMSHFANYIQFWPYNIGSIMFDYVRFPVKPVWAYTLVNGRPVYDPANSVDIEFSDNYQNAIAFRTLQYMGFNIREMDVVQFAMSQKTVENQ